ncbi:MAG: aminomethyl-transferring glycine dehydrogenase subunit GcvPB [Candidatus Omnitrophota bacterium]
MLKVEKLIFEIGSAGRRGYSLPKLDVPDADMKELIPEDLLRKSEAALPEVSELDCVRHFTRLSQLNYSVDTNFYPLGSCTMKYNPKINEKMASLPQFADLHPYQPESSVQGMLELLYETEQMLCKICGMDAFTLQPAAGAHGELTGMLIVRAYHTSKGNPRKKVIIPDSAHGTNPASAALCGYEVVAVKSDRNGRIDLDALKSVVDGETAVMMLTNPSTLGLFEKNVRQIADIVHKAGALLYLDGANMNALVGIARPGDMGFDICHVNLHKSFSTPHGGGGPGSGPVGVTAALSDYLPVPRVKIKRNRFILDAESKKSVGRVRAFYGNTGVIIKAYCYMKSLGGDGLKDATIEAVLNANYLKARLKGHYALAVDDEPCMHEFVLTGKDKKGFGVKTLDIAKRLLDYGFYAPTIYFPLIVEEAIMIEPTETESKDTLDSFVETMIKVANEARSEPGLLTSAPHSTPVRRLDEVLAARELNLRWKRPGA